MRNIAKLSLTMTHWSVDLRIARVAGKSRDRASGGDRKFRRQALNSIAQALSARCPATLSDMKLRIKQTNTSDNSNFVSATQLRQLSRGGDLPHMFATASEKLSLRLLRMSGAGVGREKGWIVVPGSAAPNRFGRSRNARLETTPTPATCIARDKAARNTGPIRPPPPELLTPSRSFITASKFPPKVFFNAE